MDDIESRLRAAATSVADRDRAICDAHRAGWTLRKIAAIVGMTHGGVRKIVMKEANP